VLVDDFAGDRLGGRLRPEPTGQLVTERPTVHPKPCRPQPVARR
jgi:hypothetical protein